MIAVFLVASLSSRLGDKEKIAVLLTAQYDDSLIASATFPKRSRDVELARKYRQVAKRVAGQFRRRYIRFQPFRSTTKANSKRTIRKTKGKTDIMSPI